MRFNAPVAYADADALSDESSQSNLSQDENAQPQQRQQQQRQSTESLSQRKSNRFSAFAPIEDEDNDADDELLDSAEYDDDEQQQQVQDDDSQAEYEAEAEDESMLFETTTQQQGKVRLMQHAFSQHQQQQQQNYMQDDEEIESDDQSADDLMLLSPRSRFILQQQQLNKQQQQQRSSSSGGSHASHDDASFFASSSGGFQVMDSRAAALGVQYLAPSVSSLQQPQQQRPDVKHFTAQQHIFAARFGPQSQVVYTKPSQSTQLILDAVSTESHQTQLSATDVHDAAMRRDMLLAQLQVHRAFFADNNSNSSQQQQSTALIVSNQNNRHSKSAILRLCQSYSDAMHQLKSKQSYTQCSLRVQHQLQHAQATFELLAALTAPEYGKQSLTRQHARSNSHNQESEVAQVQLSMRMERHARIRAFTHWVQQQCAATIAQELQHNAQASHAEFASSTTATTSATSKQQATHDLALRDTMTHLSNYDLHSACESLFAAQLPRLALLVSQLGESHAACDTMREQLAQWRNSGWAQGCSELNLELYCLLTGDVCVRPQLDWLRACAAHVWFSPEAQSHSMSDALKAYQQSVAAGRAAPPQPWYQVLQQSSSGAALDDVAAAATLTVDASNDERLSHNDLHFELLSFFSHSLDDESDAQTALARLLSPLTASASVLDCSLVWHVAQCLLLTSAPVDETSIAQLTQGLSSQMEQLALHEWSIYIQQSLARQPRLTQLTAASAEATRASVQALLARYATLNERETLVDMLDVVLLSNSDKADDASAFTLRSRYIDAVDDMQPQQPRGDEKRHTSAYKAHQAALANYKQQTAEQHRLSAFIQSCQVPLEWLHSAQAQLALNQQHYALAFVHHCEAREYNDAHLVLLLHLVPTLLCASDPAELCAAVLQRAEDELTPFVQLREHLMRLNPQAQLITSYTHAFSGRVWLDYCNLTSEVAQTVHHHSFRQPLAMRDAQRCLALQQQLSDLQFRIDSFAQASHSHIATLANHRVMLQCHTLAVQRVHVACCTMRRRLDLTTFELQVEARPALAQQISEQCSGERIKRELAMQSLPVAERQALVEQWQSLLLEQALAQ